MHGRAITVGGQMQNDRLLAVESQSSAVEPGARRGARSGEEVLRDDRPSSRNCSGGDTSSAGRAARGAALSQAQLAG